MILTSNRDVDVEVDPRRQVHRWVARYGGGGIRRWNGNLSHD